AIRQSRWVLRRDPENADMANLLGMLVLKRGDVTSAAQLISAAIQGSNPHFGLYLNMGIVEQARGNTEAARGWFQKGLSLNPGHPGLLQRLAEVS
ncbi:MAG: tetratricopeptide repeat protein, partial [Betaproteobacteria bacterium]|nr:tetratricopeptide repeat protein [Betaproteobacteria bacterium]